jgi:hypothetical protein
VSVVDKGRRIEWHAGGRVRGYANPVPGPGIHPVWQVVTRTADAPNWSGAEHETVPDKTAAFSRLRDLDGAS